MRCFTEIAKTLQIRERDMIRGEFGAVRGKDPRRQWYFMLCRNMSAMRVVIGRIIGIHLRRIKGMRHYFEMAGVANEKFAGCRIVSVLYTVLCDDVGNLVCICIKMFNRVSHSQGRRESVARARCRFGLGKGTAIGLMKRSSVARNSLPNLPRR